MADGRTVGEHGGRTVQPGCVRERHTSRRRAPGGRVILREVPPAAKLRPRRADPIAQLTAKEREVLALVAEGSSNEGIAVRLGVTARTVETHTSRIFSKLGLLADPASHRRVLAALVHLRATTTLAD